MAKKVPANLPSLVIEHKVARGGEKKALARRHALEDWLDKLLRRAKLGDCDGGSIGSGSMEVFCEVKDYAKARRLVEREIKSTEFADYQRIYKVAAEKPQPRRAGGKAGMYEPGDCLAVKLPGGRYAAAYVAASDAKLGSHVVVELDYLEKEKPGPAQFRKLKPLILTHHSWENHLEATVTPRRNKASDALIEVVGNVALKLRGVEIGMDSGYWVNWKAKVDPEDAKLFGDDAAAGRYVSTSGDWNLGGQVGEQRRWDARKKK